MQIKNYNEVSLTELEWLSYTNNHNNINKTIIKNNNKRCEGVCVGGVPCYPESGNVN